MHIYGIQKDGTDEFVFRASTEKQTQKNRPKDPGGGEEGEGEMYGETNMEIYKTICKIDG